MEKQTDWAKHSAIAGYLALPVAAIGIGVMLWLGLRQPLQAATGNDQSSARSSPIMPPWVPWTAASLYVVGFVSAALIHLKASRVESQRPNHGDGKALSEMTERWANERAGASARDEIIANLREQANKAAGTPALSEAESKIYESYNHELNDLPWPQKVALKQIVYHPGMTTAEIRKRLTTHNGFTDPDKITGQLEAHDLINIDYMTLTVRCNPGLASFLDKWFKSNPL